MKKIFSLIMQRYFLRLKNNIKSIYKPPDKMKMIHLLQIKKNKVNS